MSRLLCLTELLRLAAWDTAHPGPPDADQTPALALGLTKPTRNWPGVRSGSRAAFPAPAGTVADGLPAPRSHRVVCRSATTAGNRPVAPCSDGTTSDHHHFLKRKPTRRQRRTSQISGHRA